MRERTINTSAHLFVLLSLVVLAACSPGAPFVRGTSTPQTGLYVDVGQDLGPISPYVYASNTGPWAYFAKSEEDLFKQAGLRMVRWPGGNWGDENDPFDSAIDDYITLCRRLDAEPLVHVRLLGGSAERAAEMVRTFNIRKGFKVHYWAVGNEPDLYASNRHVPYTVADYVRDFKAFRTAMRSVDPSIVVMGPEISQYTGTASDSRDADGVQWMDGFLKGAGDAVDFVSYHRYPFGSPAATPQTLQADPPHWSAAIEHLAAEIHTRTGRHIPFGVTEANSDWIGPVGRPAGPDSQLAAIWWTDVMGRLIRGRADIVGHFAMGRVRGLNIIGGYFRDPKPNPVYQVYLLYQHWGTKLIYARFDDDMLPLFAAQRDDGAYRQS